MAAGFATWAGRDVGFEGGGRGVGEVGGGAAEEEHEGFVDDGEGGEVGGVLAGGFEDGGGFFGEGAGAEEEDLGWEGVLVEVGVCGGVWCCGGGVVYTGV